MWAESWRALGAFFSLGEKNTGNWLFAEQLGMMKLMIPFVSSVFLVNWCSYIWDLFQKYHPLNEQRNWDC